MTIKYTRDFIPKLKKQNVRIRKSFKKAINQFAQDLNNPELNNHALSREWQGHRSINITSDWRAIYKEGGTVDDEIVVYFTALGIHKELYK